jgi:hypothetical protein
MNRSCRRFVGNDGGYGDLGYAIVEQAVIDFKNLRKVKKRHIRESSRIRLKKFFRSEWCSMLSNIDTATWEEFIAKYDIK